MKVRAHLSQCCCKVQNLPRQAQSNSEVGNQNQSYYLIHLFDPHSTSIVDKNLNYWEECILSGDKLNGNLWIVDGIKKLQLLPQESHLQLS